MSKKYYCVTSAYYDSGRVTASITNVVEAEQIPKNTYVSMCRKDIYNDWFEKRSDAVKHVAECRKA